MSHYTRVYNDLEKKESVACNSIMSEGRVSPEAGDSNPSRAPSHFKRSALALIYLNVYADAAVLRLFSISAV